MLADCFQNVHHGLVTPNGLKEAAESFLKLFMEAFGVEYCIAKFHWLLHYWKELQLHETLFACFVHERKHKQIRRYACPTVNTRSYETSILQEVTCQQVVELNELKCFSVGLIPPKSKCGVARTKSLLDILFFGEDVSYDVFVSMHARVSVREICSKGDVVIANDRESGRVTAGMVMLNVEINSVPMALLKALRLRVFSNGAADWDELEEVSPYPTDDLSCSCKWMRISDSIIRTLIPPASHHRF